LRSNAAEHGTDGGYFHHLRVTHDEPCEACKAAHAAVNRGYAIQRVPCPDCGRAKSRNAKRCRECAGIAQALAAGKRIAEHGTDSGYYRHQRHKEPACEPCLAAHREANRKYGRAPVTKPAAPRTPPNTCSDCGKPAWGQQCRSCAMVRRNAREREEELAFTGRWVKRGGVWRAA
jgi:hypothetical protein